MSLDQKKKTADLLGICIKAGKTVKGFDSACEAVKTNKAACVLTASDASPKTVKEVQFVCGKTDVPVYMTALTKDDIGKLCGKATAVLAVTEKGFAEGFRKLIQ